jgi:hypothetical protein
MAGYMCYPAGGAEQLVALPDQRGTMLCRVGMRYLADQALGS